MEGGWAVVADLVRETLGIGAVHGTPRRVVALLPAPGHRVRHHDHLPPRIVLVCTWSGLSPPLVVVNTFPLPIPGWSPFFI